MYTHSLQHTPGPGTHPPDMSAPGRGHNHPGYHKQGMRHMPRLGEEEGQGCSRRDSEDVGMRHMTQLRHRRQTQDRVPMLVSVPSAASL